MPHRLRCYRGHHHRRIPGLSTVHNQADVAVIATSMADAHRQITAAGLNGWSLYAMRGYWSEGGIPAELTGETAGVFYRPDEAPNAPLVPWDQPYPIDHLPARLRTKDTDQ